MKTSINNYPLFPYYLDLVAVTFSCSPFLVQNWRTAKVVAGITRHFYYTASWQCLEERLGASTAAERQFIWGLRYIDDLVLRDRDTNADGTLDERLFPTQDANWNVTSIVNTTGATQERYAYEAYGAPGFITTTFVPLITSAFTWEMLFASYRHDHVTGLSDVRWRTLHSTIGEWISRDPVAYDAGDWNLYRYCANNPLTNVDPLGRDWLDCMAACLEDNEPLGLALEAAIAQLAVGWWPKEMYALIAESLGDQKLANAIRFSARQVGGSSVTTMPKGLMTLLKLKKAGNPKLLWNVLSKGASKVMGPILIAYGLAAAAVESHCFGFCCAAWYYGIEYTHADGNIGDAIKEYFTQK